MILVSQSLSSLQQNKAEHLPCDTTLLFPVSVCVFFCHEPEMEKTKHSPSVWSGFHFCFLTSQHKEVCPLCCNIIICFLFCFFNSELDNNIDNLNTWKYVCWFLSFFFFLTDKLSSFQATTLCGGRTVHADLLDSGDMECSLCMRWLHTDKSSRVHTATVC